MLFGFCTKNMKRCTLSLLVFNMTMRCVTLKQVSRSSLLSSTPTIKIECMYNVKTKNNSVVGVMLVCKAAGASQAFFWYDKGAVSQENQP